MSSLIMASAIVQSAPLMRMFALQVDPKQQAEFLAVGRENLTTSVQTEKGTLAMYTAPKQDEPNLNYVVELYQDQTAYEQHRQSPQYQKFAELAKTAILGREVFELDPQILLEKSAPLAVSSPQNFAVRLAEIEVEPNQNLAFGTIIKDEMQQSMAKENGVLVMYAGTLKTQPNRWYFFEVYQDDQAYQHHREQPYFKAYIDQTAPMLKSKKLIELNGEILMNKGKLAFKEEK